MDRSERERYVQGWVPGKKRATLACHSECLHNGIILIVYIFQNCTAKVEIKFEISKQNIIFFENIAIYFLLVVYIFQKL